MKKKQNSRKYKNGVSHRLLDLCVGSNLEEQRLAEKVEGACRVEAVIRENDGQEVEAKEWLKLHKKNLND